ncbi:MAG TPA: hypothetical protein VKM94_25010 [Blastocatellia bacterium]|nr:hypothetical protein [Blastocatellia bacterium]
MSGKLQKRLRFDHAEVEQMDGGECRVKVTLSLGPQVIAASAESVAGEGLLRVAALAALRAVELSVEGRFTCTLADVDRVTALGKDLIAVLVDVRFEQRDVQVFGSCQVSNNQVDAVVKAALNATNRFFDLSMRDSMSD